MYGFRLIHRYSFFFLLLTALAFAYPSDNSTAPYIFNDLHSLLIQWPNTFHPNGHSIVPGELAPYTLLYHARKDIQVPPPSPEWLAFDPEMSYAVMASKIPGPTYLYTYRTVKPAKVLYFNGMSAAWGDGWLDTQYCVITGKGKTNGTRESQVSWWDDYGRAKSLCQWGKSRGFSGIVRMNAGFEIIWCDFESPELKLVSSLNITPPGTPESRRSFPFPFNGSLLVQDAEQEAPLTPQRPPGGPGHGPGGGRGPGRGGGGGRGPWGSETAPLARSGNLEWMRAAMRYQSTVQPHLKLTYSDMVSFYDPRYHSLIPSRSRKLMQQHFLWEHVSDLDVRSFVDELDSVVSRIDLPGTGFDWQAATSDIVSFWGDRIVQIEALLDGVNGTSNLTAVAQTIQQLSYSPLDPFIAYGEAVNASGYEIFFELNSSPSIIPDSNNNSTALHRCIHSATDFLEDPNLRALMTPQEHTLKMSIETVLERLCTDFGTLFTKSTDNLSAVSFAQISSWHTRIKALMGWLEWSTWLRCEEVCERDSVCSMPAWPIAWDGGPFGRPAKDVDLKPTCRRLIINDDSHLL